MARRISVSKRISPYKIYKKTKTKNNHVAIGVRVKKMNTVVSTKTLFKSNANFSQLTTEERNKYIESLTDEFLESADVLMLSLKDK